MLRRVSSVAHTIASLLQAQCSDRPALLAPNRSALTYAGLCAQVERTITAINSLGIGHNDRVAVVVPNGPESASAFVGLAAGASVAPLNPALGGSEFSYHLASLRAKALFVHRNGNSEAIAAAKSLNIPVLELVWSESDPAGTFSITGNPVGPAKADGPAGADDIALVLHTSGTTSSPKMVPLSQRNLMTSAGHIAETLRLSPEDRCINVMPLFHIHGLVAGVLASLAARSSVFCTPGFSADAFFHWMAQANCSWYTAVPTMHQAVLAGAQRNRAIVDQARFRFIRSSSAPLPPAVMHKLEQTFNAPVIESYGMTEAAHQVASNPLPPMARKPGTVGIAAGPEIAIMDASGGLVPAGATGEVVVRGPNVMSGYMNDPQANTAQFTNGWLRTGDLGVLDDDGYLRITGRLKEIINRGGQKVSPSEIDDVLMDHPEIDAAAAFAIPHPTLGEEVAAVVVVRKGSALTERSLINFLQGRLATFKVPQRVVFVDVIPKGPTGKIARNELAAALGVSALVDSLRASRQTDNRTPTALEETLLGVWKKVLGLERGVGLDESFFLLGGDSLRAVQVLTLVEEVLGRALPHSVLITCQTVAQMAEFIESDALAASVVPIQPKGNRPPFFCVHELGGQVLNFRNLARYLRRDQPFYGIQAIGLDSKQEPFTQIEDMARHYVQEIRKSQPVGPYYLGGYSMGGIVAFEMTRQLRAEGDGVDLLALIDTYSGPARSHESFSQWLQRHWAQLSQLQFADLSGYLAQRWRNARVKAVKRFQRSIWAAKQRPLGLGVQKATTGLHMKSVQKVNKMAVLAYRMQPLECDAVLFKGELQPWDDPDLHDGWNKLIQGTLEIRTVSGRHGEIMIEPHVRKLAYELTDCLERRYARRPA